MSKSYPRQLADWSEHLRDASFFPHFALPLGVLAGAALILAAVRRTRPSLSEPRAIAALTCALSIVLVLALFATQPNQEPRYLLPLIPLLAALSTLVLAWPGGRLLLAAATALVAVECVLT